MALDIYNIFPLVILCTVKSFRSAFHLPKAHHYHALQFGETNTQRSCPLWGLQSRLRVKTGKAPGKTSHRGLVIPHILPLCDGTSWFGSPLFWPCNHVELMFDGLCRDTMEAQQRTLGGHVKIAIHTIYRRGLGLVWTSRFPDQRSAVRDQGGGTSQLHSYKSIAPLKIFHLLLGILWNCLWTLEQTRPKGKWMHRETRTVCNPVVNLNGSEWLLQQVRKKKTVVLKQQMVSWLRVS